MKAISVELSNFVWEVERFDVIAANSTTDDATQRSRLNGISPKLY